MKFSFIAILGLLSCAFIAVGCSTESGESNADSQVAATSNTSSNASTAVNSGEPVGAPESPDGNATAAEQGDGVVPPAASALQSKLNTLRKSGKGGEDFGDVEALALKNGRMAPDDSVYASYLTDAGYEVRSFKKHPQLLKVVKRMDGENQTLKVYLRNGKVVELSAHQIGSLATAAASVILQAAGVQPLPLPTAPPGPPVAGKKLGN